MILHSPDYIAMKFNYNDFFKLFSQKLFRNYLIYLKSVPALRWIKNS
jgi:hypothetical protein